MGIRVYEVARDLGMRGGDLAGKINGLSLGFSVNNHMSTLSDEQVEDVRRALDREARDNMVEERIRATVIRRKPKRKRVSAAEAKPAVPTIESVFGTPSSRSTQPDAAVPVTPGPQVPVLPVGEVPDPEASAAEPGAVVATPAVEPTSAPVAPESGEGAALELTPPPPEATVAPETEPAAEAAMSAEPEAPADPGTTPAKAPAGPRRPGAQGPAAEDIVAALARRGKDEAARRGSRGGAQVTGMISPELLQARLAADNKTFGPAPQRPQPTGTRETFEQDQASRRKRKRTGKKVYGQSELYDRRSSRRRTARKGGGQSTQITTASEHKRVIKMEEAILVSDLAHQMGIKAGEIALKLMMELGVARANINTPLDMDTAELVAETYGFTVERVGFDLGNFLPQVEEAEGDLKPRPPVVTVMGHVDHGKTSLLDAIRMTDVAEGEAGGITQHIGAYQVDLPDRGPIVFLDTPGHEAFTALRARGAQATDIVILVVAADDGVMPQTVEAINHAKDSNVPIVVAVNKVDKPGANTDRVMQALSEYNLLPEAWGGETLFALVSAKEKTGIDDLLEAVALQAEVLELNADPDGPAVGIVIESRLDTGRGPVATVLVQSGTLEAGQIVSAGGNWGRIRALTDDKGGTVKAAGPSTPVEITGLDGVPEAGEKIYVVGDEKSARTIAEHISGQQRQAVLAKNAMSAPSDLESLQQILDRGELKELKIIVKTDVQGSEEALRQALSKLSNDEVEVKIVHSAVGGITENDVNLAASSSGGAIILGFNVRPDSRATQAAEQFGVKVLTFSVIYEAVDDVKKLLTGMLAPVFEERYLGRAEVRDTFGIPRVGTVAGCLVVDGNMRRGAQARVVRDSRVVYESSIGSLRRFKEDVREVKHGFECGIMIENFNDVKLGDVIESFEMKEIRPSLS